LRNPPPAQSDHARFETLARRRWGFEVVKVVRGQYREAAGCRFYFLHPQLHPPPSIIPSAHARRQAELDAICKKNPPNSEKVSRSCALFQILHQIIANRRRFTRGEPDAQACLTKLS
jgi:hypothetical protein